MFCFRFHFRFRFALRKYVVTHTYIYIHIHTHRGKSITDNSQMTEETEKYHEIDVFCVLDEILLTSV